MARGQGRRRAAAPDPNTEGNLRRGTYLEHRDAITEKLRIKREADSALSNAYKRAKGDGIDIKEMKQAMADALLTTDELAIKDRKLAKYREWEGKPIGFQAAMDVQPAAANANGHDPEPDSEEAAAEEKHANNVAYEEGISAGKAGADIASCRYQPGTEEHQTFSLGWSVGQKAAVEALGGTTRRAEPLN